jgi:hypothetical protein
MKVDDMVNVPEGLRSRLRPFQKKRTYVWERRKFTKDELISYLKKTGFRTKRLLESGRKPGEPRVYDYVKEFGSWGNIKTDIFGMKDVFAFNDVSLVKSLIEFKVWTVRVYRQKRKDHPDIFPPLCQALKMWGGKWSIIKGIAKQKCYRITLNEYAKLWRKLGRAPTLEETKVAGIPLERLMMKHKTKPELDKDMELWKPTDET